MFKKNAIYHIPHTTYSKGFTLIEILVAAGIFAVVLGISMITFSLSNNLSSHNTVLRDTSQSGRYAIEAIARDVRMANADNPFDVSGGGEILNVYRIDEKGQLLPHKTYIYTEDAEVEDRFTIFLDGEDMISKNVSIINEPAKQIFEEISTENEQKKLKINFQVKYIGKEKIGKEITQTLQTSITTRSYPGFNK